MLGLVDLILFISNRCSGTHVSEGTYVLIWGSIRCALAMKIGGEAKAHEMSNTQKWFGQILNNLEDIKIIKFF